MESQRRPGGSGQVRFSVLENGLDFLFSAVSHLAGSPSERDLKYALLHLAAGIELILKDRLRREHWTLVFNDVNKADRKAYADCDFASVDLSSCLRRLESVCGVSIDEAHRQAILNLKAKRNRFEHFASVDSIEAIKALAARVLEFAVDFASSQFDEEGLQTLELELLNGIRSKLPEFGEFVARRMAAIQPDLRLVEHPPVACPACTQEAIVIEAGCTCRFCGYSADGEAAAAQYTRSIFGIGWKHIADGGRNPVHGCPECWSESLVDIGSLRGDYEGVRMICLNCGLTWDWDDIGFCARCGAPFATGPDRALLCANCLP
jgi:hypothetical protein